MTAEYVSDNLAVPNLNFLFPNMVLGDREAATWPYFRKEIDHAWYVDRRNPQVGFINKDEAAILYSSAELFAGRRGLEIGAWRGWSTAHLAASRLRSLDVVEPLLSDPEWRREFEGAIEGAGGRDRVHLAAGPSPEEVVRLGTSGRRWSFVFIDGDHDGEAPTRDALTVLPYLEPTALILLHDLVSPHVAAALRALRDKGLQTMVYQTAQMMGVAWRGDVAPVPHRPDAAQNWSVPDHLTGFTIT
jgi:predicted O-methyltransferase YrrM